MKVTDAVDQINQLLDSEDATTTNTSMRLPKALQASASLAVRELGAAPSTTALTAAALRVRLEAIVVQAVLEDHYEQHPEARATLAELAIAAAELDGHPLARDPERLRRAATEIIERHPDADADDVLLWAEAQAVRSSA